MAPSDLVVFAEDWGGHPSSTQHLVGHLLASRRVVWVNSIGLRRPRLTQADALRAVRKLKAAVRPAVAGPGAAGPAASARPDNLTVISPLAVPWPGNPLAERLNGLLLGARLRPILAKAGIARPILWASLPSAVAAVGRIGERAVVYYCGDDFGALSGVDHAPVLEMERRLVARADLVIAASAELACRFPAAKTHLVPHGVDVDLFSRPAPRAADLPEGRVAGFYGSISDWLDLPMIAAAAAAMPDWIFVFVGPVRTDVSRLAALPNVRLLGPRPHAALPSYVQHWTVSLIPFRDTPQIRACNPLKLREYLASGTPIAATRFPALVPYEPLVCTIDPAAPLAPAIHAAAGQVDGAARRAAVADEGWDRRAAAVDALLSNL
ncbi:glycosyltransferase [Aquabacter spiritensis]|uniref:Glycosyltransferase involved in cell wall biosynthesis n=1 Tax=Aquabacter spiritensis TaxID=933073 RepID=A0A4R3M2W7_9HYPH|nr:glycosyltransferase [Aquabacter spiritensis]TCT06569.1 glycosyltransferase involved in cell wall biosynthesis [Aquabacter spiritensis]